jgi:hypothetical protein
LTLSFPLPPILQIVFISYFVSVEAFSDNFENIAIEKLEYIKKYALIAPERARKEILQSADLKNKLSEENQIEWLLQSAMIANRVNNIPLLESSLKSLNEFNQTKFTLNQAANQLYLLGHYNLKSTYNEHAIRAYYCTFDKFQGKTAYLKGLHSISGAYLSLNELKVAEEIAQMVYRGVLENNMDSWKGAAVGTLGIFALHRKDYNIASQYFRQSMDAHQHSKSKSGEYHSGLNLLLTYVLKQDLQMYERLVERLERLDVIRNDSDRKKYLYLIKALAGVVKDGSLSVSDEAAVKDVIKNIESQTIRTAVDDFISPPLGIDVKPISKIVNKVPKWVIEILDNNHCSNETVTLNLLKTVVNEKTLIN